MQFSIPHHPTRWGKPHECATFVVSTACLQAQCISGLTIAFSRYILAGIAAAI